MSSYWGRRADVAHQRKRNSASSLGSTVVDSKMMRHGLLYDSYYTGLHE